jgi:hypothetical protein
VSGDTVVVGAPNHSVNGHTDQGAAYIYEQSGSAWAGTLDQTAELNSDGEAFDMFGDAVAVSGMTVVVGAPYHQQNGETGVGAAYVFVEPGSWSGTLTENATLEAAQIVTNLKLGTSVSVSGTTVLAGASSQPLNGMNNVGAVYEYLAPGAGWSGTLTETDELAASDGASGDTFGFGLGVSGGTIVVGAFGRSGLQGAAYVFATPAPAVTITSPASGASYAEGQRVDASYSCTPSSPATIVTCSAPLAGGAPIDTGTVGRHTFTVNATDSFGATESQTVTYAVVVPKPRAPSLRGFKESHRRWRAGSAAATISRAKPPIGTAFTFKLNEAASVRLTFRRKLPGREAKVHGHRTCVAASKHTRRDRKCTRSARAGTLTLKGRAGGDTVAFDGRLSRTHKLSPDSYSVTIAAANTDGKTSPSRPLTFTVVS